MPNYRLPRGRQVMLPPDYNFDQMFSGFVGAGPNTTQFSQCGIYNSSTQGEVLVVYAWSLALNVSNLVLFSFFQGPNPGVPSAAMPLNPYAAAGPGVMFQVTAGSKPTAVLSAWPTAPGVAYWPYPWPAAIIPPGWNWAVTSNVVNTILNLSLWWEVSLLA
jgi:hypothetical protein